jgi:hypothetical protein
LLAVLLAAFFDDRSNRKIEAQKQAARLAAEAFADMMHAYAENSEARTVLMGNSADDLLRNSEHVDKSEFISRLTNSRVKAIAAKNRMLAFGSTPIAEAVHAALGPENTKLSDADTQKALCELVQRIREDLFPEQPRLADRQILETLFGEKASSVSQQ